MFFSGKTKSYQYPNNKSPNNQSVSHNINELKSTRLKIILLFLSNNNIIQ